MGKTKRQGGKRPRGKKHPHARGEDPHSGVPRIADWETPPRTWGRPVPGGAETLPVGNTPTHVGKTKKSPGFFRGPRKHPHARGEDPSRVKDFAVDIETPPRTWGRQRLIHDTLLPLRNTPTHVGKTSGVKTSKGEYEKHPHARGEDPGTAAACCWMPETPPRTWGRPSEMPSLGIIDRNTPTHVGKTCAREVQNSIREKHPHARGEDVKPTGTTALNRETPPRTWGRLYFFLLFSLGRRNTPTHVGKTLSRPRPWLGPRKHPHARGEDIAKAVNERLGEETPPRTWGRLFDRHNIVGLDRNTPTHVGKTLAYRLMPPLKTETPPRTWGRPCAPSPAGAKSGKHPHARGEDLGTAKPSGGGCRNTPTHVGKTLGIY